MILDECKCGKDSNIKLNNVDMCFPCFKKEKGIDPRREKLTKRQREKVMTLTIDPPDYQYVSRLNKYG